MQLNRMNFLQNKDPSSLLKIAARKRKRNAEEGATRRISSTLLGGDQTSGR